FTIALVDAWIREQRIREPRENGGGSEREVEFEAGARNTEHARQKRVALQRRAPRRLVAQAPQRQLLLHRRDAVTLQRGHVEDVFAEVDLELEVAAVEPFQLHDVQEDRTVLHRAGEDRNAVAI